MSRFGESDCEQAIAGVLAQPINALTSLAFIPAGMLTVVAAMRTTGSLRRRIAVYGGALLGATAQRMGASRSASSCGE